MARSGFSAIKDLLVSVRTRYLKPQLLKVEVTGIIASELGVEPSELSVTLKGNDIYIKAHPVIKNELRLKEKKILLSLQNLSSGSRIFSLR